MENKEMAAVLRSCSRFGKCPEGCPVIESRGKGDCVGKLLLAAADQLEKGGASRGR